MLNVEHHRSQKEQMKSIEATKVTLKKRKGVVPFVRVFPVRPFHLIPAGNKP